MPFVEAGATAYSIGTWIWRNVDESTFRARQAARGSRGGRVMTPATREANRARATEFDLATALEYAL